MKTLTDPLGNGANSQSAAAVPASGAKTTCSTRIKLLFTAITIIATVLTYQTVKQAIGLHRAIFIYEENAEIIAKVPVHISFAGEPLLKAEVNDLDRVAKAD